MAAARYAMRADAFYVRHADGVLLRNSHGSSVIGGTGAYPVVELLFRELDGNRTLDDICAGLPEGPKAAVIQLVETLARKGFLREITHRPQPVAEWLGTRYASHLAYLAEHADQPADRFGRVRSAPVAVAGEGVALRALLGALGELGLARVFVVTTASCAKDVADVEERTIAGVPDHRWRVRAVDRIDFAAVAALPDVADAAELLIATDANDPRTREAVARTQAALGIPVGVLGSCGDAVVAAPWAADRCWECVSRSMASETDDGLAPAVVPATIAALHLARTTFARLAGVELDGRTSVVSVSPLVPVTRTRIVTRHPDCPLHPTASACPDPAPVVESPPQQENDPVEDVATDPISFDAEQAFRHTRALREDPTLVNPADWRMDWAGRPWPVTVYRGGVRIPVGTGDPLGRLLRGGFAMYRVRFEKPGGFVCRRPIPSGGATYPTEVYVLVTGRSAVYHYDPYRHELVDIGLDCPVATVRAALGPGADVPPVVLMLTSRFWKNFYKYADFGFRLGAVDAGIALGRALRLGRAEFGAAESFPDFTDDAANACLGVDGRDESCYAVIGLPSGDVAAARRGTRPVRVDRSSRIRRSPRFDALHAACSAPAPGPLVRTPAMSVAAGPGVALPEPSTVDALDAATMARRTSNGHLFSGHTITREALSTVLHEAVDALRRNVVGDVGLCCAAHRVDGVPPGWYRHRPADNVLMRMAADSGAAADIQRAVFVATLNAELAAFTVLMTGAVDSAAAGRGVRGYREQQLAVGVAIEALTLAAPAVGLGAHPLLGFDATLVDERCGLTGSGHGVHAIVCVGAVRPDANLEITAQHS